jgi:hypothetical protein
MRVLAYLDPGSGSMLLQMLLGGIAGVAVSIKMFGKRVFRVLTFWKRHDDEPAQPAPTPAPEREPEKEAVKETV